jgi:hypothetical protein
MKRNRRNSTKTLLTLGGVLCAALLLSLFWPRTSAAVSTLLFDDDDLNACAPPPSGMVSWWPGDGDTTPDWIIVDSQHVQLRAERAGTGSGRVYTITVACTDSAGNTTTKTVSVTVPKSQGK